MAGTLTPAMIEAGAALIEPLIFTEDMGEYEALEKARDRAKRIYLAMNAVRTMDDAPDARPDGVEGPSPTERILMTLGYFRDDMPPEAIKLFQEIAASLALKERSE